jgi:formyltetrahydrofolate deformylase
MRNEIKASSIPFSIDDFKIAFQPIAKEFSMSWSISDSDAKKRVVLMVSKESHCLADLLHRWHSKELDAEIVAVISNHDDLRRMVEWHDIPYHHVPVDAKDKAPAFAEVNRLVESYLTDLVVLARYMQILPAEICEQYSGRVINIHHSFLPSFAGAKPYHQAYDRGVKLIGATCHYVTQDLDEGPILDQDVIRISHSDSIEDMVRLGKDAEKNVLARGLRLHLEDRVIIHENKTVVF